MIISEPRISETAPLQLIGFSQTMHLLDMPIAALWQKFRSNPEVRGKTISSFYYMQHYHEPLQLEAFTPTALFTKWAMALRMHFDAIPEGMEELEVAGGWYAQFEVQAPPTAAKEVFAHIYGEWLPQSGYQLVHRHQVEVIPHDYIQQGDKATEVIWIPIEKVG